MVPCLPRLVLHIGSIEVAAPTVLMLLAVPLGYEVAVRRGRRLGWPRPLCTFLVAWSTVAVLVGAHVGSVVFSDAAVLRHPLLLLARDRGLGSAGGFLGAVVGGFIANWSKRRSARDALEFFDIAAFAFPFAWLLMRSACALDQNHVSAVMTCWLCVNFPSGARLDLGLLEFLYTGFLAALFVLLRRLPLPAGATLGLLCVLYGPARFGFDTLRVSDHRYMGWTAAQFVCVAMTLAGAALLVTATGPLHPERPSPS